MLYTIGGQFFAPHIAEARRVPAVSIYPYPAGQPTRAFASMFFPLQRNLGGPLNRWTHLLFDALTWIPLRGIINAWREERLGLPPMEICAIVRGRWALSFALRMVLPGL